MPRINTDLVLYIHVGLLYKVSCVAWPLTDTVVVYVIVSIVAHLAVLSINDAISTLRHLADVISTINITITTQSIRSTK